MTRGQFFVLNWVIAVVVAGMVLPLGFIALFLAGAGKPIGEVISHGELFLVAGNSVVASAAVLVSSRVDQAVSAAVACLCSILTVGAPSYAIWAYLSTQSLLARPFDSNFTVVGGWVSAIVGLLVSAEFVRTAAAVYLPRQPRPGCGHPVRKESNDLVHPGVCYRRRPAIRATRSHCGSP